MDGTPADQTPVLAESAPPSDATASPVVIPETPEASSAPVECPQEEADEGLPAATADTSSGSASTTDEPAAKRPRLSLPETERPTAIDPAEVIPTVAHDTADAATPVASSVSPAATPADPQVPD
eukprot:EG_transcript_52465